MNQPRRFFLLLSLCLFLPAASCMRFRPTVAKFPFPVFPRGGNALGKSIMGNHKKGAPNTQNEGTKDDRPDDPHHESKKVLSCNLILNKRWTRYLYYISAMNPLLAVWFNDYSRMLEPYPQMQTKHVLAKTYETLFFFAKLKPRVSFAIGAVFRALQLTTAFQYVFDPTIGVGFGLNLLALYTKSRWPATIVLGWTITKPLWKILGACPPSSLPVPITVTWKKPKDPPSAEKGYRIGI